MIVRWLGQVFPTCGESTFFGACQLPRNHGTACTHQPTLREWFAGWFYQGARKEPSR